MGALASRSLELKAVDADMQKLLSFGLYKRTQGRITRQATFAALAVAVALGCWQLSDSLINYGPVWQYGLSGVLLLVGWYAAFRVVNYPRFADFLIAVEAEMNKVTWPSRKELVRSAIVVLVTIFLLAMILFLYDLFWRWFLMDFLNIDGNKRLP